MRGLSVEMPANRLLDETIWATLAALVGGTVFIQAQNMAGFSPNIAEYMGQQIVSRAGQERGLTGAIGWSIHYAVAFIYASLYGIITTMSFFPTGRFSRLLGGLILATGLGWLTTLITPPAIVLVIAIFAREGGLPWPFPALNTDVGFVLWNHLGFFGIAFLFHIVIRDALVEKGTV